MIAAPGRGTLARAALVSVVLVVGGCGGCHACDPTPGTLAALINYKRATWNRPTCRSHADCEGVLKCSPEQVAECSAMDIGWDVDHTHCWCTSFRIIPNPDGGSGYVPFKCVRNPDGGTPVCGEWEDHKGVILGPDGGSIVDEHGVVL